MCVEWGNAIGCCAVGRTPKKSRTAPAVVRCAGVNTAESAGAVFPRPHAGTKAIDSSKIPGAYERDTPCTARPASILSGRRRLRTERAHVIDDVPHLLLGHLALERLHLLIRSGAVANGREDLAVAQVLRLSTGEIRRMRALWRHRTVTFRVGAMAEPAILLIELLARADRFSTR